ncbi:DEAD/DEAH box helicase [Exiguobacterium acetylicum]|uniref:DEAD/DEAH box helicase n=1 Tax=Exiguobacterium acetylicum TaxID=41170 RepID=UPI001CA74C01|nr:ATP-binding domain-containing protein [Exiguobacterium acetylicum]QZY88559.1 ATP-binding domain-containing protein [Exiguobacterium acetylicum]
MIEIIIPHSDFEADIEAVKFVDYLKNHQEELSLQNSKLYYRYPLLKEFDENLRFPGFMLVSPLHGIIIFSKDNQSNRTFDEEKIFGLYEDLDELFGFILARLIKIPNLRKKRSRRDLNVQIESVIYTPNYTGDLPNIEDYDHKSVKELGELTALLNSLKTDEISEDKLKDIYSIIDGTRNMPRPTKRDVNPSENLKGAILSKLDSQIATFDQQQRLAALTITDGPQRIRGMAGSGKTIILAMKVALLHIKNPNAKILYTFYTKSLYDQVKQLITRFYRMYDDTDPNWDNIHILHAWGGKSLPGVYYNSCIQNNVKPLTLAEAKKQSYLQGKSENAFEFICDDLLLKTEGNLHRIYDYVMMDEGQDFPKTFYWLCRKLVKNDCLIWAYDELQNILDIELQETLDLFANPYGDEGFSLPDLQQHHPHQNNDIVLHKSYRNPAEILVTAHALGFGIYNDKPIQRLENKDHWEDLGYEVIKGNCISGEETEIKRPLENSPSIISEEYDKDEIVRVHVANNFSSEVEWVCNGILNDIQQKLLPEDIMVICLDDRNIRDYFDSIEDTLSSHNIFVNNVLSSYSGDVFHIKNKVTLTTVYRAKGNEAASVYIIGADSLKNGRLNIVSRNKLFTSMTRAKAWLSVSGTGTEFSYIVEEISTAKSNFPSMNFIYPGIEEIKTLRRELAKENEEMNRKREAMLRTLSELGMNTEEAIKMLQDDNKK